MKKRLGKPIALATALIALLPAVPAFAESMVPEDAASVAALLRSIRLREPFDKAAFDLTGDGIVTRADAETFLLGTAGRIADPQQMKTLLSGSLLKDHCLDVFSYNGIQSDGFGNYKSDCVSVTVTTHREVISNRVTTWYVADIYIRDIECFRTGYSEKKIGKTEQTTDMAKKYNAIIALSGDYFAHENRHDRGLCIRNGNILREALDKKRDVCVLYRDGTMETYLAGAVNVKEIESHDPWQAWCFGPALLDGEGHAKRDFNTNVSARNPRAAIGYYEPGHYCFVVVDGRQKNYSYGLSCEDLSLLFERLGCKAAYNLDGGDTAVMATATREINQRDDTERECSDILYICDYDNNGTEEQP